MSTSSDGNQSWRSLFVGREQELQWLIDAWKLAKAGQPQFLVLLAESGLGKTRLVQEFYRCLSKHDDPATPGSPQGYWPDAFDGQNRSLDVNPRFPEGWLRSDLPWLWWAIRFLNPGSRNQVGEHCGLLDSREALAMHLEAIETKRRLKALRHEMGWKVGDIVAEVVGGLVPGAGWLFAGRDAKKLAGEDRREEKQLRQRLQESPAEVAHRRQLELADRALADFRRILDQTNPEAPTIPVIVVLDDAQWADPLTLSFTHRLIDEARRNAWPLLVVVTHWEAEWHQQRLAQPTPANPPQCMADVPRLLGCGDEWPGLRRVPRVADLAAIVRTAFPGLTPEQQAVLLDKADGNPLLLEEYLLLFQRKPVFFDERNLSNKLSPAGLDFLRTHSTKLHELIQERFDSLEDHVQRALGWSSVQGVRFLTAITKVAAKRVMQERRLDESAVETALQRAAMPHSIVQFDSPRSQFNLGEFRQAAFREIALRSLSFDADELAVVQKAVGETLSDWLVDGSLLQLPPEELRDALSMAGTLLRPTDTAEPRDWANWGRALIARMRLDRGDCLWDSTRKAALEFVNARPGGWPFEEISIEEQWEVEQILASQMELESARAITADWVAVYRQNSAALNNDSRRNFFVTLNELGRIEQQLGHTEKALAAFTEGLVILGNSHQDVGQGTQVMRDLSISLENIGVIRHERSELDPAISAFGGSLEIRRRLLQFVGPTAQTLRDLSVSLNNVGRVQRERGDCEKALAAFSENCEISRQLLKIIGPNSQMLHDLSVSLGDIGELQKTRGDLAAAALAFNESLRNFRQLIQDYGPIPQSLRGLSCALDDLGDVYQMRGDWEAALFAFGESLDISRQLLAKVGATPQTLHDLSTSWNKVGNIQRERGERERALEAFNESLAVSRQSLADMGETPLRLRDLSVSLNGLGSIQHECGEIESAFAAFNESLEVCRRILTVAGETPQTMRDLQIALNNVGKVYASRCAWDQSVAAFSEGLAISRQLIARWGATPQTLRDLSVSLANVGEVQRFVGKQEAALESHEESHRIFQQLLKDVGSSPQTLHDLAFSSVRLAYLHAAPCDFESVNRHRLDGITFLEQIEQNGWWTPQDDQCQAALDALQPPTQ
mgnify:CR=1 FL=1